MESLNLGHIREYVKRGEDDKRGRNRLLAGFNKSRHPSQSTLPAGRVHVIEAGRRRQDVIRCHQGSLWLTQAGDLNDYRLGAGDVFIAAQPGRILVYALKDARIEVASTRDGSC